MIEDQHHYNDSLSPAVKSALDAYLAARSHHEQIGRSRAEYASLEDWQSVYRKADSDRRDAHNRAACECLACGLAPRLRDREATLLNARNFVADLLGFSG